MDELPRHVISAILDLDDESFDVRRDAANVLYENRNRFAIGTPQLNDFVEYVEKHAPDLEGQSDSAQITFLHMFRLVAFVLQESYGVQNGGGKLTQIVERMLPICWRLVERRNLDLNLRGPAFSILGDFGRERDAKKLIQLYENWEPSISTSGNDREIHMKTVWKLLKRHPSLVQRLERLKRKLTRQDRNDERIIYLGKYLDNLHRHFMKDP